MWSIEQKQILKDFKNSYNETKEIPRALYGVGSNTQMLIEYFTSYNIKCIVDDSSVGESIKGFNVISSKNIIGVVKEVVIVAAYQFLPSIYKRINFLEKEGIILKTVFGDKVSKCIDNRDSTKDYQYPSEIDLLEKVASYNIVSISIFNVLLNRRLLENHELYKLIQLELVCNKIEVDFYNNRILAEKLAYQRYLENTKISNIYEEMNKILQLEDNVLEEIYRIELVIFEKNLNVRKAGLNIFNLAKEEKKEIILTVQTFFEKDFIEEILQRNNICGYNQITIYTKNVKEYDPEILYINDEDCHEINHFQFINYWYMIKNSNISGLIDNIKTLSDKWLIGSIFTEVFDSPFELNKHKGKICISNTNTFAKMCLSPIVLKFTLYSIALYSTSPNCKILYTARDGFLFYNIYNKIRNLKGFMSLPESEYVLASTRGVKVPNMLTEKDIIESFENIFNVDDMSMIEQMIFIRFNVRLDLSKYDKISNSDLLKEVLLKKDEIIKNANEERKEYLDYLVQFKLNDYENIIVFDLITRGTVFYNFSKLINRKIIGCCFGMPKLLPRVTESVDFEGMLGLDYTYNQYKYFFLRNPMLYEDIFSEDRGRFIKIKNRTPIFMKEKSKGDGFKQIHDEIIKDVVKKVDDFDFDFLNDISLSLVDNLLKLSLDDYSYKEKSIKSLLKYDTLIEDAYLTYEE